MGELETHAPGTTHYLGPRERVHNIYSTLWTKGLYEGQRRDFGARVFSLPRAAYAGIQRNGAAFWSNDIDSTWEVFKDQVVIGQGVCLSGQQYWCTDIGGFFSAEKFDPELYIRWFEWGVFCPVFRTHGTRPFNEPWEYGPETEKILVEYIRLRYRLMPYIYSLARKVTGKGTPIMRAMCMDFGDDPVAVEQTHQFMFGPALLVAPVVEEKARSRKVYLPKGTWYDFWTDERIEGGQWIEAPAPLSRIPLYVRAGSIIPMASSPALHAGDNPGGPVEVHVYPGAKGSFELYADDGATYEYEKGNYTVTLLSTDSRGRLSISGNGAGPKSAKKHAGYATVVHSPKKPSAGKSSVQIDTDLNLKSDGRLTVHATIRNGGPGPVEVKADFKLPAGWAFDPGSGAGKSKKVTGLGYMAWEAYPKAEALPLVFEGSIEMRVIGGKGKEISKETRTLRWGSAFATRFSVAGCFRSGESAQVEADPGAISYTDGDARIGWNRDPRREFNCFGYVDCRWAAQRGLDEKGEGIAYAKCRVWSESEKTVYAETAADYAVKIWINGAPYYEHDSIIIDPARIDRPVTLGKGWNPVLVRVRRAADGLHTFSGRELGFRFRFVGDGGRPAETLLYQP
jgi:hypothetical protein